MEPFKYICHYWGKSSKSLTKENDIHLLIYHCLDVAAVADCWWDQSVVLQNTFCRNEMLSKQRVKAWLLFFIALHDIGKFDIRFQGNDSNLLIVFYVQIMPDDFVMQLHRF